MIASRHVALVCAAFDVLTDPRAPKIAHVVEAEAIKEKTGLTWPHTSHCLGTGEVVIRWIKQRLHPIIAVECSNSYRVIELLHNLVEASFGLFRYPTTGRRT